jgi:hypothetical protein
VAYGSVGAGCGISRLGFVGIVASLVRLEAARAKIASASSKPNNSVNLTKKQLLL